MTSLDDNRDVSLYHLIENPAVTGLIRGLAHLEARLAGKLATTVVDEAVVVKDVDELQVVALAHQEIVGVVCGRDLFVAARVVVSAMWIHAPGKRA